MKSITFILVFILFTSIYGDRKYFGRSYLANTLPSKSLEMEIWNTGRIGKETGFYYRFQPRFEIEYGISDRLNIAMYYNFNQISSAENSFISKSFSFSSLSIELKYRLTEINELIIDPALYFELYYGGDKIEYETKLLLSKRIENFITALNINSEIEQNVINNKYESKFEMTCGIMYDWTQNFAFGFELRHHRNYENIIGKQENYASYIGPTFNFLTDNFYFTFNLLVQFHGASSTSSNVDLIGHEKYEFRTILGIEL